MPVSSARLKNRKLLTDFVTSFHDPISTSGIRNVVSSTSSRLMPSMPTNQWMP
jgi:hypothetical protein